MGSRSPTSGMLVGARRLCRRESGAARGRRSKTASARSTAEGAPDRGRPRGCVDARKADARAVAEGATHDADLWQSGRMDITELYARLQSLESNQSKTAADVAPDAQQISRLG